MQHYEHWELIPGQLSHEYELDAGCREKGHAEEVRATLPSWYYSGSKIMLLDTVENPLDSDHPDFDESQGVSSKRWCIIVRKIREEEQP